MEIKMNATVVITNNRLEKPLERLALLFQNKTAILDDVLKESPNPNYCTE
jgi:hypothetical protein